jgi:hypothetical protein
MSYVLTFDMKWAMFLGLVSSKLKGAGYRHDVFEMAESLDWSFESDYLNLDPCDYEHKIDLELELFKEECPEDFK